MKTFIRALCLFLTIFFFSNHFTFGGRLTPSLAVQPVNKAFQKLDSVYPKIGRVIAVVKHPLRRKHRGRRRMAIVKFF